MEGFYIDRLRDTAFKLRNKDPDLAFDLITLALEARPNGPAIKSLFDELKSRNDFITISMIGNCQVTPLGQLLREKNKKIKVLKVITAHLYTNHVGSTYNLLDKSDYIITQPISDSVEGINTKAVKERYSGKVVTIPNLFYMGFHQDWGYFPRIDGVRLKSPIGDYHNKTVVECFIKNLSVLETQENVNSLDYNKRKYGEVAEDSINELARREKDLDIKMVGEVLNELNKNSECFHTFNHPKKYLLNIQAEKIFSHLEIKSKNIKIKGECLNNVTLRTNPIVSARDVCQIRKGGEQVDLKAFIEKSFEIYCKNPKYLDKYKKLHGL